MQNLLSFPFSFTPYVAMLGMIVQAVVSIGFAIAVYRDASERNHRKQFVALGSPLLWALAALITGGLIGTGVYWVMHYSTLSKTPPTA